MSEKKLVPEGAFIACDKGSLPGQLTSGMIEQISIYGQKVITESDNVFMINFLPLGPCLCLHGQPCMAQPLLWDSLADGVLVGGSRPVLEDAKLPCALGGQISIFPTPAAALAVLPKAEQQEKSFWGKTLDFGTGLGKGLWTGAKGTATGVYDLGVWAGKHSLPYMLLNPEGYKEQLEQDVETAKALASLAADVGTWAYRNSAVNQLTNPSDYAAVQQENAVMVGKVVEKAKAMDAEDWGNFTGQVGFEVLTEVATAGAGLVVTGMKAADRTVDVARVAEKVDDLADAARAADKVEDASDAARTSEAVEEGGDAAKAADKAEDVEDVAEEVAGPEPLGDVVYGGRASIFEVDYVLDRKIFKNTRDVTPGRPNFVDDSVHRSVRSKVEEGWTNKDLMEAGYAPIGPDGKQINLHHLIGEEPGTMVELTTTFHKNNHRTLHGLIEDGASFRNDPRLEYGYTKFRRDYWKLRASDF